MTSKYKNRKTILDGIEFDSRKEANRYAELLMLLRGKAISDLRRQVKFELIPAQKIDGKIVERPCYYIADFVYKLGGETVVEDTKGIKTDVYIIKRKLMLQRYGIRVKEI